MKSTIANALADYDAIDIYYKVANDQAMFPHIVFNISNCIQNSNDLNRFIYYASIDVYNKENSRVAIDNIVDSIIDEFNANNIPQDQILPTFYFSSVNELVDDDKTINHFQLTLEVHLYERN